VTVLAALILDTWFHLVIPMPPIPLVIHPPRHGVIVAYVKKGEGKCPSPGR